ncbi:methyltransferase domain-containing protein [Nitrospinaceae bacterium]|nr:methyltransferase domain-containing protein [Nitrospinaceae bacterium]
MEEKEVIPSSKFEVGSEKPDRDIRILADFYSKHHLNGNRRNQSVSEEKRSQLFKEWMGKNKKVLDMGCRDGILTRHFIEHNEVTGLDIDKQALEACRENLKIETKWADFSLQIPIPTSSFDVVVAGEVIEHLPYPEITIAEISRILKPEGLFIGSVPNSYHLKNRLRVLKGRLIDYDQTHLRAYNVMLLRQYLEKEFVIEELTSCRGKSAFLSVSWFGRDLVWKCRKK